MNISLKTIAKRGIMAAVFLLMLMAAFAFITEQVHAYTTDLWVQGIEVTPANESDVLGDLDEGATVVYDYSTKTLTLDGAAITIAIVPRTTGQYGNGGQAAICAGGSELNIVLKGENQITPPLRVLDSSDIVCGIAAPAGDLNISGSGSLTIASDGTSSSAECGLYGIFANGNLSVTNAQLDIEVGNNSTGQGLYGNEISIGGSSFVNVSAKYLDSAVLLLAQDSVIVKDTARVKAECSIANSSAVHTVNPRGDLVLKDDCQVSLAGGRTAIYAVENWSDHNNQSALVSKEPSPNNRYLYGLFYESQLGYCWDVYSQSIYKYVRIPALPETPEKAAGCEEDGNVQYFYDGIYDIYYSNENGTVVLPEEEIVINATGHNWDGGKVTKEPTASEEGVKTFTCSNCSQTRTESIPKLPYDPSSDPGNDPSDDPAPDPAKQMGEDGTAYGKGASAEAAEAAILALANDNDPAGTVFSALQFKAAKVTKNSIKLSWKKVSGAKSYVLYANKCGKKNKYKKLTALSKNSLTVKKVAGAKLKKGTHYKFLLVALDKNNKVISVSKTVHAATAGGKAGNDKKITTKAKKNKVALKVKKTFKLGAKAVPASKKLKVQKHRALSYESSDPKVASVDKKGVIKGVKKGKCQVYVYAQNGVCAVIKVTVK